MFTCVCVLFLNRCVLVFLALFKYYVTVFITIVSDRFRLKLVLLTCFFIPNGKIESMNGFLDTNNDYIDADFIA